MPANVWYFFINKNKTNAKTNQFNHNVMSIYTVNVKIFLMKLLQPLWWLKIYKHYHYSNSIKAVTYNIYNVLSFLKLVPAAKITYIFIINNLLHKITKNSKTCLKLTDFGNLYQRNMEFSNIQNQENNSFKCKWQKTKSSASECACRQHKTWPCTNQRLDKFCCSCISVFECFNKCYCLRRWQIILSGVVSFGVVRGWTPSHF